MAAKFRAGADARPITPDLSAETVYLAGFDPDRPATGVHDDLMVRTVAISDGGTPVVVSVCDLVGLTRTHEAKGSHVVACTHTHHGPDGLGFWGRPLEGVTGIDAGYLERVRRTVEASRTAAVAALEPCSLRSGSVQVEGVVANFRNPDVIDDELSVLQAVRGDGTAVATLAVFACHPEVVAADSTEVTADFPGYFCSAVEQQFGGVAVFAVGALGGMQSPATEVRTHEEARRIGELLAAAVGPALDGAADQPDPVVTIDRTEVVIDLQNPIYELGMELGLVPGAERRNGGIVTEVSLVRLGDALVANVPGELFPELGLRLKEAMRSTGATTPVVIGLADDELGYLVPEEDFVTPADYLDPGAQYEESFSPGPSAATAVVGALLDLVARTGATA